jgi:hypothetical protein
MVKRLKKDGYWVRGVDLKYPEHSETQANEFIVGDLRDEQLVSRVLWSPRLFVPVAQGQKNYALRWYYRNLVMASMHARSLSAFLVNTSQQNQINESLARYARIAQTILMNLQNPDGKSTYRTRSLKVQIENDRELQTSLTQLNPRIN